MQCVLFTLYNVHKAHIFCTLILYIPKYAVLSMCTMQCIDYYIHVYIIYIYTLYRIHNTCEVYTL